MGIKNFLPMLRRFAPNSASNWIHLRSFENDRVAVDASCYVYQALYSLDTEKPYLTGIYNFAKNLLALNLKPIFVFDSISKRNPNKRLEAIKRYQRKSLDALRVTRYEKREKRMEKFLEIIGDLALLSKNEFAITINHAMKNENIKKNFKLINFNLNKIKTDSDAEFFKLQNKSSEKEEVLIKNNIAENLAQYSDQLLETFSEETLPKPEINNLKYEFDLLNEVLQKKKVDAKDMENVETTKKIFSVELKTLKSRTARIKKDMILELMEMYNMALIYVNVYLIF
ncbi:hypothetical protein HK099_006535 [Clydaea vesicula]|uniref:XPG N-terminal domain-containing protein n=1 Tax=Clydaea vesicula TaxID=447962 RepID=A0AAD5U9L3_9FUNG|nr:hypothetical protein HK099_006535 [Clydaea vesicula]